MKIPKLLLLGTLVVALCVAVPAFASEITLIKNTDPLTPNIYYVGDTIHYVCTVGNPPTNAATNTMTLVEDILPDGSTQQLNVGNVVLAPGASVTYHVYYVVDAADLVVLASGKLGVRNRLHAVGSDSLGDDIDATTSKTSRVIQPSTDVGISADPLSVCSAGGTDVTLTVTEENDSTDTELTSPSVVVSDGGPIATLIAPPDSGDDGDGVLEAGETWTWDVVVLGVSATTTFTAVGHGTDPLGNEVTWCEDTQNPPADTICDQDESATVEVTAVDPPVCNITGPTSVCEGDSQVQYCSENAADSYSWQISGDGEIDGSTTGDCVLVNPTGPGGFTLSLHICNGGCCSDCRLPVDVIPTPDCRITGPESLCQDEIGLAAEYCTDVVADGYLWEVLSGPATIDGADDAMCVDIIPSDLGTIVLKLSLYNEVPGNGNCWNSCEKTVTVSECGQTYCGFTQGYYGNTGGKKCGGQTTTELLDALLAFDDVVVGLPGRSITFDTAACIILRLPAGGTPSALPVGLGNRNCTDLPGNLAKKNKPEINNVLVGQVVALTLNVRLGLLPCISGDESDGLLGTFVLPDEPFCTVPYGKEEACVKHVDVSGFAGMTVDELLALANTALGGGDISPYTISQINGAVTAINEGFDECRTIVPCIRPEICGNGCDDDGDGLVDLNDPDCQI